MQMKPLISASTVAATDQVDGPLVEGGGLQDLLHGDRLQLVRVQLLALIRDPVVHDDGQRAHPRLLVVRTGFLGEGEEKRGGGRGGMMDGRTDGEDASCEATSIGSTPPLTFLLVS